MAQLTDALNNVTYVNKPFLSGFCGFTPLETVNCCTVTSPGVCCSGSCHELLWHPFWQRWNSCHLVFRITHHEEVGMGTGFLGWNGFAVTAVRLYAGMLVRGASYWDVDHLVDDVGQGVPDFILLPQCWIWCCGENYFWNWRLSFLLMWDKKCVVDECAWQCGRYVFWDELGTSFLGRTREGLLRRLEAKRRGTDRRQPRHRIRLVMGGHSAASTVATTMSLHRFSRIRISSFSVYQIPNY